MEIKFRGKIKYNGNHRFSGDWVYGYYLYDQNTEIHYIKENDDVDGLGTSFEVIPESVGQFTGLKDSYDVDVYLGDVLDLHQTVNGINLFSVFYDESKARFSIRYYTNRMKVRDYEYSVSGFFKRCEISDEVDYEVIGNIIDNKELLDA